jgi:hypothetical protein
MFKVESISPILLSQTHTLGLHALEAGKPFSFSVASMDGLCPMAAQLFNGINGWTLGCWIKSHRVEEEEIQGKGGQTNNGSTNPGILAESLGWARDSIMGRWPAGKMAWDGWVTGRGLLGSANSNWLSFPSHHGDVVGIFWVFWRKKSWEEGEEPRT